MQEAAVVPKTLEGVAPFGLELRGVHLDLHLGVSVGTRPAWVIMKIKEVEWPVS